VVAGEVGGEVLVATAVMDCKDGGDQCEGEDESEGKERTDVRPVANGELGAVWGRSGERVSKVRLEMAGKDEREGDAVKDVCR
jgi:hypothetical protein